ncbi:hypothetical protein [Georgenia wangjunii]|uniref:hypothetical protein n=1 Tax=Georgenia wangjunii TaxID=3117730 RepID=UPI002F26CEDA
MPEREARAAGCLAGALGILLVLALAAGAVVAVLTWVVPARVSDDCTVTLADGTSATLDADQADNAALIAAVAVRRALPARAVTIALATAVQESRLRNIDYGDRDSLGLFQQRPSQGWGTEEQILDPVYATGAFYDALVTVPGYADLPVTEAAQLVQRSAFPDAYADHEPEGRAFASALTGHSPAALTCRLALPDGDAADGGTDVSGVVLARLERDFGALDASAAGGVVTADAASLAGGDAGERLAWSLAHWAVATASVTGVTTVEVDGQVWRRSDGEDARWASDAGATAGPGLVRIS